MAFLSSLAGRLPKVPPRGLLLIAGLVWLAAGFNIFRLGVPDMAGHWTSPLLPLLCALAVFFVFFLAIFRKLIIKHTGRIRSYEQERVMVLHFFDRRSYVLIAFMMTFGILLRGSRLVPPLYLGTFYTGLGAALLSAGAGFLWQFAKEPRLPADA